MDIQGTQSHLYSCHGSPDTDRRKRSRHSTLRTLLDTENGQHLLNVANGCCNTHWGGNYGWNKTQMGYTMVYDGDCFNGQCDSSHHWDGYRHNCYYFCAPPGTTRITFELWGGGGSGASACCCQQGNPGGAGAYAIKTLCAQCNPATGLPFEGGTFGGMCWEIFVAPPNCCSQCCIGVPGCNSSVIGCGLTNFCAGGGLPGKTCCFAFYSGRLCGSGIGTYSAQGCQETQCLNEYRPCYPMACSGMYSFHPFESACDCECSCYFGADWGIPGRMGWFRSDCTPDGAGSGGATANACFVKIGKSYPGGFGRRCSNYSVANGREGLCCTNLNMNCMHGQYHANDRYNEVPGVGGMSAFGCSGVNICGAPGARGLVLVHFS